MYVCGQEHLSAELETCIGSPEAGLRDSWMPPLWALGTALEASACTVPSLHHGAISAAMRSLGSSVHRLAPLLCLPISGGWESCRVQLQDVAKGILLPQLLI